MLEVYNHSKPQEMASAQGVQDSKSAAVVKTLRVVNLLWIVL